MNSKLLFAALAAVAGLSACATGVEDPLEARAGLSAHQPQVGVRVGGFWGEKYKLLVCKCS